MYRVTSNIPPTDDVISGSYVKCWDFPIYIFFQFWNSDCELISYARRLKSSLNWSWIHVVIENRLNSAKSRPEFGDISLFVKVIGIYGLSMSGQYWSIFEINVLLLMH
jgi:hypothetical protein